jgi:ankyrin repeat protein
MRPSLRRTWLALATATALPAVACAADPTEAIAYGPHALAVALESSPDVGQRQSRLDEQTLLASTFSDVDTLRVLLDHGANATAHDPDGRTALTRTVEAGCVACAILLLRAHADPNKPVGPRLDRPLDVAARHGSDDLTRVLLEFGADPNSGDGWGETPLHAAALADEFRGIAVVKLLIEKGADPALSDVRGDTPLHKAAMHDAALLVSYYASIGLELNKPNALGETPLDRAVELRRDRAAETLYRLGGKTATTQDFEPPLVDAARVDDVDRSLALLGFGADPSLPFAGKSAIDVARENGSDEVLALFVRTGN